MPVPSRTIKITGVPEELLGLLDERVRRRHALGRSEYLRELIRKDLVGNQPTDAVSFREMLAPILDDIRELGMSEEDVDALVERERSGRYRAAVAKQKQQVATGRERRR